MPAEELFYNFGYYGPQVTKDYQYFRPRPGAPLVPISQAYPGTDLGGLDDIILGGRQRQFTPVDDLAGVSQLGQPGAVAPVLGGRQPMFTSLDLGAITENPASAQDIGTKVPVEVTVNGKQMVYVGGEGWMTRDRFEEDFALMLRRPVAVDPSKLPANIPKPPGLTTGTAKPVVLDRLNKMTTTEDRSKGVMEKKIKRDVLEKEKENAERALYGLTPLTTVKIAGISLGTALLVALILFGIWKMRS